MYYRKRIIGWINDQKVGIFEDNADPSGTIGVISSPSLTDAIAVYFDNVIFKTKSE